MGCCLDDGWQAATGGQFGSSIVGAHVRLVAQGLWTKTELPLQQQPWSYRPDQSRSPSKLMYHVLTSTNWPYCANYVVHSEPMRQEYPPKSASNELHDQSTFTLPQRSRPHEHPCRHLCNRIAAHFHHRIPSASTDKLVRTARPRVTIPYITMGLPGSQLGAETHYIGTWSTWSSPPDRFLRERRSRADTTTCFEVRSVPCALGWGWKRSWSRRGAHRAHARAPMASAHRSGTQS